MAMNATKRKFNTLLQGLGSTRSKPSDDPASSSPTSPSHRTTASGSKPTSTASIDADILHKRRRLGLPDSTAPRLGSTVVEGIFPRRKTRETALPASPRTSKEVLAKYSPTDRGELLKRLRTFQEITDWTPKPDRVSEVEWAKRGWVCQAKETVRCLLCHRELIVKLNRKVVDGKEIPVLVPSEIEQSLVEKYADLIVTSHREDCLWRKRGCDDSLIRLSLTHASSSLESLRQRYDELCSRRPFLPYDFNLRLPDDLDLDLVLSQLPPDFFTNPSPTGDQPLNRVALALALLGWQGLYNPRMGPVPNSASCHTCLRRLGLWMFKSKEVSDTGEVIVPAPMDFLDPTREHRFFCPWANAKAQAREGSRFQPEPQLPGWKVLVQTIANDAHLRSVYEGRPRTAATQIGNGAYRPSTPRKQTNVAAVTPRESLSSSPAFGTPVAGQASSPAAEDAEQEKERDAKDKERWARLRRVKSLFDTKGSRKSKRPLSRPGTGYSARSVGGQT